MKELEEDMREAEEECRQVKNQIQKVDLLLRENINLFAATYRHLKDEKAPISPKEVSREVIETPRKPEKGSRGNISNSLPRFMTSTAASRQRQSSAERETAAKARSLRSVARSSIQFTASQSMSYSDPQIKAILQNSSRKSRYAQEAADTLPAESPKCNGSESSKTRSKLVTSSDPNLRTVLSRHRRRMSDLI